MSTFLPFITGKSSEEAMFRAVLKVVGSSSDSTIINLYSILLNVGVDNIRRDIDKIKDGTSTIAIVNEIIASSPQYHIHKDVQTYWKYLIRLSLVSTPISTLFAEDDLILYYTVLAVRRPSCLTGTVIDPSKGIYEEASKPKYNVNISDLTGIKIAEQGATQVGFTCWEEFKAYIAHTTAQQHPEETKTIMPVFLGSTPGLTQNTYNMNNCINPYRGN